MKFNPVGNQGEAIKAGIGNILVSAAAGSGKTTVLVERIVSKLVSGELSLDKVLVVTFTNEAADKAKTDIENNIRSKMSDEGFRAEYGEEAVRRLASQLELLPGSYIQTMNSFCNRVIKEKGYLCADSKHADLMDPGNSILDSNELDIILSEAAGRALSGRYATDTSDAFFELTDMFGNGRTDDYLIEDLVKTYRKLRSLPDYLKTLNDSIRAREEADSKGEVIGVREVTDRVVELCKEIDSELIDDLCSKVELIPFLKAKKANQDRREEYDRMLTDVYSCCRDIIECSETESDPMAVLRFIKEATSHLKFIGFPSVKDKTDEEVELIEGFKVDFGPVAAFALLLTGHLGISAPSGYKGYSQAYGLPPLFGDIIASDTEDLLDLQKKRTERSRVYAELLASIDEEYALIKTGIHGMDFADQEHLAKMILDTEEGSGYYRNKFLEIYIDEYQDNSCLQDAVIALISRPEGNVFRVGDVKQSIYKFRYAEPSLFIGRMEEYQKEGSNGRLITLNYNLRSTKQILGFVNDIFVQVMTREGAEIEYDEEQRLNWLPETAEGEVPRLLISDCSSDTEEQESFKRDVLAEVKRYVSQGYKPEEICVLTRGRDMASKLSSHLNENGFPASYVDQLSIFTDNDIHGVIDILICIGNELRDEYLTGVLLSGYPMTNFTVNELAKIHAFCIGENEELKDLPLIDRLREYASKGDDTELRRRTETFLEWFRDLRYDTVITDIGEITDRIYKETGIASLTGERGNKMVRFRDWLCENFTRYGSDIASVAASLEKMKINIGDKTSVEEKRRDKDKIACMTIHSSKGLDFKCVIVTQLFNKRRSGSDSAGFVFDGRMGLVSDDFIPGNVTRKKAVEKIIYEDHEFIASNAEEIRLLYVALTRAKERMSIVLPMKLISKSYGELIRSVAMYRDLRFSSKFWLCGKSNSARKLEFPFLAAVLRTEAGERKLQELCGIYGNITRDRVEFHTGFRGPEILLCGLDGTKDQPAPPGNEDDPGDPEDGNEDADSDLVTGDLDEILSHSKEMIRLCGTIGEDGRPVFKPYRYKDSFDVPFKVSVTSVQTGEIVRSGSVNLTLNDFSYYLDRQRGYVGDSPFETGSFVHKLFRFIDMEKAADDSVPFEKIIDDLIGEGIIRPTEKEKAMSFCDGILSFAGSDIGRRLIAADLAGNADYERPIVFATPVLEDHALIQGVIDCMFTEDGQAVILDYKTTRYNAPDETARAAMAREDYSFQVDLYAAAVEAAGIKVKEKYLYLVRYGQFVPLS
ncbi:MAG: UvrD-helicase domain-containing protein [Clostridiales bacterium]|nr:UvrD-helicase domain-containing protein [Clostridiales bacterium]